MKKHNFTPIAFLIAGFLSLLSVVQAQNLLANGDFENGTQGWSLFAPAEAKTAGCTFDVTGDAPHDGGQAANSPRRGTLATGS